MVTVTDSIKYAGVNDHLVDLFEGQYTVPNGMSYNSYVILDDKIAVMDTVDIKFTHEWLDNLEGILDGRKPDYLIVQHMEPDHSANIQNFLSVYPGTTVVASAKAFAMIESFSAPLWRIRNWWWGKGTPFLWASTSSPSSPLPWYTGRK